MLQDTRFECKEYVYDEGDCVISLDQDNATDCDGNVIQCFQKIYLGDGSCDDGSNSKYPNLTCDEFDCDDGDCCCDSNGIVQIKEILYKWNSLYIYMWSCRPIHIYIAASTPDLFCPRPPFGLGRTKSWDSGLAVNSPSRPHIYITYIYPNCANNRYVE